MANDHFVPQTYLRGFIDPQEDRSPEPLRVFAKLGHKWSRKSTRAICAFRGFETHSDPGVESGLRKILWAGENSWPAVVAELRKDDFIGWVSQLPLLISFMALLSLRSPLFRLRFLAHSGSPASGLLDSSNQDAVSEAILREADPLRSFLGRLSWALHVSRSTDLPVITSDHPLVMEDLNLTRRDLATARRNGGFALLFPIARDCCLTGSDQPQPSSGPIEITVTSALQLWQTTAQTALEVVISPAELDLGRLIRWGGF
jgi:hypothetical protein